MSVFSLKKMKEKDKNKLNIHPDSLDLDVWHSEDKTAKEDYDFYMAVQSYYRYVESKTIELNAWYMARKEPEKKYTLLLRRLATLFAVGAIVFPVFYCLKGFLIL